VPRLQTTFLATKIKPLQLLSSLKMTKWHVHVAYMTKHMNMWGSL